MGRLGRFVFAACSLVTVGCGRTSSDGEPSGGASSTAGGPFGTAGSPASPGGGAASGGLAGFGASGGTGAGGAGGVSPQVSANWGWEPCGSIPPFTAQPLALAHHPTRQEVVVLYDDGHLAVHAEGEAAGRVLRPAGDPRPNAIALSTDGESLAQAVAGGIEVWSLDGAVLAVMDAQDCPSANLRFSLEGDRLVAWDDRALCVWDATRGELLHWLDGRFTSAALNGDSLVTAQLGTAPAVLSYALPSLTPTAIPLEPPVEFGDQAAILEISPRGDSLAGSSAADGHWGAVWLWSIEGELIDERYGNRPVYSLNGEFLRFGGQILETATASPIGTVAVGLYDTIASVGGSPLRVAQTESLAENVRAIAVYDARTGHSVRLYGSTSPGMPMRDLAVSSDGTRLAAGYDAAVLWQIEREFGASRRIGRASASLQHDVDFSPDSELLLSGDGWELLSSEGLERADGALPPPDVTELDCYFTISRASPLNRWLSIGEYAPFVRIRSRDAMQDDARVATPGCNARATFSSDERFLATTGPTLYRTADWSRVWPTVLVPETSSSVDRMDLYQDVAFVQGDSELLVSQCGTMPGRDACRYALHSAADGSLIRELPEIGGHRASVSKEGHWVSSAGVLLHLPSQTRRVLDERAALSVFTPDGDVIAALDDDTLIRYCRASR